MVFLGCFCVDLIGEGRCSEGKEFVRGFGMLGWVGSRVFSGFFGGLA